MNASMVTAQNKIIKLLMALRRNGITGDQVLSAIERVPRTHFIPDAMMDQAYEDIAVPIGLGQTISQPTVVATMTQALELNDRHKVLEIGTGTGYQACVLSKICRRVYTIERHTELHEIAEKNFKELGVRNITAICGDGMKGWPRIHGIDQAPFDRIIVTAAASNKPPPSLMEQLHIGGIMIAPVGKAGAQMLKRYKKEADDTYSVKDLMPVRFVPLLPDIASGEELREVEEVLA
ncbi:MAG: protein-L-isoaspartate(D-aspartate) O-methyltransferase [Alphaproteobacteria bacterium]|nr:protein-L-isoaspartate(D-aspartate) O-methyltransferase [Alphaproteobacteria bacterium]